MHDSKTRVDTKSASHKRKTLRIHSNHSRSSRLTSRTPAARVFGKHWGRTHWWQPVTAIVEDSRHTGRGRGFPRRRWTAGQTGTRAKRSPSGVLAAQKQTERNRGRRRRTPWPAPATGSASTEPWAVVLGSRLGPPALFPRSSRFLALWPETSATVLAAAAAVVTCAAALFLPLLGFWHSSAAGQEQEERGRQTGGEDMVNALCKTEN